MRSVGNIRYFVRSRITNRDRSRAVLIAASAAATLIATGFVTIYCIDITGTAVQDGDLPRLFEISLLYSLFYIMIYSNLIYQLASFGHFRRQRRPVLCARSELEKIYERKHVKDLLILVPSYKEEEDVIRQTLISAALVEYPRRRVVLLIDDPPEPATSVDRQRLARSRQLPQELQDLFVEPAKYFKEKEQSYHNRLCQASTDDADEARWLAHLYDLAADWLDDQADALRANQNGSLSHSDQLFIRTILLDPAAAHRLRAAELAEGKIGRQRILKEYRRLACLFNVEFSSFERKPYANLSHIPNKAMNLNSYLSLIGYTFREVRRDDGGCYLERCDESVATVNVPASDYVATVDADSLITSDYALRLVHVLEQPGNERIAVAQSPYTAMPGTPYAIERAAAASTDAQFFNHQGLAFFDASFWVGASALMRYSALEDIAREVEERGLRVKVYIDDKILIEDAAATIDLLNKGWRVYHDGGRLSYSATPADFGALIIQRRRWANGGLLILPNLLRHLFRWPWSLAKFGEGLVRLPSLTSASVGGIGLPILLLYRFDDSLVPVWMPIAAMPYYLMLGCDLVLADYRWRDLPRVYALNLLLIPVNLAGTLQSLQQALSGRPIPFRRTPKIAGRTAAPPIYLAAIYGLCLYAIACSVSDVLVGNIRHMLFAAFNGVAVAYGILLFVGLKATGEDVMVCLRSKPRLTLAKLALRRSVQLVRPPYSLRLMPRKLRENRG